MIEEGQLYGPLRGNGVTREGMSIVPPASREQDDAMRQIAARMTDLEARPWSEEEEWAIKQLQNVEVYSDICVCMQVTEVKSRGGIILPGQEKKQRVGRVLAAGPGRIYENGVFVKNPIKAGDYVVFGKYASGGEALWFRQQEFLLLRAGDVIGKLHPDLAALGSAVHD